MMSDVRGLYDPSRTIWPQTNVVPRDPSPQARETRATLAQFMHAVALKPLHMSEGEHARNIETYLDTMPLTERVFIEIELQTRDAAVHSFDYDPLKG